MSVLKKHVKCELSTLENKTNDTAKSLKDAKYSARNFK